MPKNSVSIIEFFGTNLGLAKGSLVEDIEDRRK